MFVVWEDGVLGRGGTTQGGKCPETNVGWYFVNCGGRRLSYEGWRIRLSVSALTENVSCQLLLSFLLLLLVKMMPGMIQHARDLYKGVLRARDWRLTSTACCFDVIVNTIELRLRNTVVVVVFAVEKPCSQLSPSQRIYSYCRRHRQASSTTKKVIKQLTVEWLKLGCQNSTWGA